jgi:hypothetical protein
MSEFLEILIGIAAVFSISAFCSIRLDKSFSISSFLSAMSIGVAVLIWVNIFPPYMILLSILMITGQLIGGGD